MRRRAVLWLSLLLGLFLGLLIDLSPAQAQVTPRVDLYSSYTDNVFNNLNRRADWITRADIDLDLTPSPAFNLYYSAHASVFSEQTELFSHTHSLGLGYQRPFNDRDLFYAGAQVAARLDRSAYDFRDFIEGTTYASIKAYPRPDLLLRGSYNLDLRDYRNEPDYGYAEQSAFLQLSRFLPSRTTLQAGVELGLKTYLRGAKANTDQTLTARTGSGRHLMQLIARAKIAQSLAQNAGLQLEYIRRANLAGTSRFADTQLYNPDDELFDDRYAYEGHSGRSVLKYLAGGGVQLQATGRWERRHYPGRPALDLDGFLLDSGATRRDIRRSLRLAAERSFYPTSGLASQARLRLEWSYLDTDSNDLYYDTAAKTYTLGVEFDF